MVHVKETELIRGKTSNDPFALCLTDTPSSESFPTELKRGSKSSWNQLGNHYVQVADVFG